MRDKEGLPQNVMVLSGPEAQALQEGLDYQKKKEEKEKMLLFNKKAKSATGNPSGTRDEIEAGK